MSLKFAEGISEVKNIKLYLPEEIENRGPVVSFNIEGLEAKDIGIRLENEYGIIVRTGLHCAPLCHKTIGTFPKGTIRISTSYFNTDEEIESAINAVREISTDI